LEIINSYWLGRRPGGFAFESSDVGPPNLFSKFNIGVGNRAILDGITLDGPLEIFHGGEGNLGIKFFGTFCSLDLM